MGQGSPWARACQGQEKQQAGESRLGHPGGHYRRRHCYEKGTAEKHRPAASSASKAGKLRRVQSRYPNSCVQISLLSLLPACRSTAAALCLFPLEVHVLQNFGRSRKETGESVLTAQQKMKFAKAGGAGLPRAPAPSQQNTTG